MSGNKVKACAGVLNFNGQIALKEVFLIFKEMELNIYDQNKVLKIH